MPAKQTKLVLPDYYRKNKTQHVMIDGPDGPGYHCTICGISACEDIGQYNTCEKWIVELANRIVFDVGYQFGNTERWREFLNNRKIRHYYFCGVCGDAPYLIGGQDLSCQKSHASHPLTDLGPGELGKSRQSALVAGYAIQENKKVKGEIDSIVCNVFNAVSQDIENNAVLNTTDSHSVAQEVAGTLRDVLSERFALQQSLKKLSKRRASKNRPKGQRK